MSTVRDELFRIGWLTADVVKRFAEIQDSIRSWRVLLFAQINFAQHTRDVHAINKCFDEIIAQLEKIIPEVTVGSKEDDLTQALGHYLCAVKNSVLSYEHLARLIDHYSKKERIRGAFRVWRARQNFESDVKTYLDKGAHLQRVWEELKYL